MFQAKLNHFRDDKKTIKISVHLLGHAMNRLQEKYNKKTFTLHNRTN